MLTWLRERISLPRHLFDRRTALRDAAAGAVLGIESVPDGLASGLLAGVNPVAGLYGYLFGLAGGALFTGTAAMAIQGTGGWRSSSPTSTSTRTTTRCERSPPSRSSPA